MYVLIRIGTLLAITAAAYFDNTFNESTRQIRGLPGKIGIPRVPVLGPGSGW